MTAAAKTEKAGGNLFTPKAILSYANIWTPQPPQNEGEKAKYGCTLVFTPEEQKTERFKAMKAEVIRVARKKWGSEADDMIREGKIKMPFLSGDKQYPEGSVFIRPRSENKPGVVDRNANRITDEAEVYSGILCIASVSCFAYDKKMNKGVTFGLGNLQKLADGERLDGRVAAEAEFSAVEGVSDDDLADLIGK